MFIRVGIVESPSIEIEFSGSFFCQQTGRGHRGGVVLNIKGNKIGAFGSSFKNLNFRPIENSTFTVKNVVIGKNFHWQESRDQRFEGEIEIIVSHNSLVIVNKIDLERYIYSVIASEMSSNSPLEFLKAHAVASRSWILALIHAHNRLSCHEESTENEIIRWYEHDSHKLYDVCADDHCQRYQGVPAVESPALLEALRSTAGEIISHNGRVCDARFHKCCGGHTELFSASWADKSPMYLEAKSDSQNPIEFGDLRQEESAYEFIKATPKDVFCNVEDSTIISKIFNGYDQKTDDFFRWKVKYTNEELSQIISKKSGFDFGRIVDLVPIKRYASGRIVKLKVVGEKLTMTVGKELEIRRWLSESHLYSSAFIVEKSEGGDFTLRGAGWGHGVGMCQVGAAQMAINGQNYRDILNHYYPHTRISVFEKK